MMVMMRRMSRGKITKERWWWWRRKWCKRDVGEKRKMERKL